MWWNLPNLLTVLRLLAAPCLVGLYVAFYHPLADWFALGLFLTASVTDLFDGYLARRWKQETRFGAMLDPIADKVMIVTALLLIASLSGMDPWILLPASLIVFREIFISGLREFLGASTSALTVTYLAKFKTAAQMFAIAALFSHQLFSHYGSGRAAGAFWGWVSSASYHAGVAALWLAALLTLVTGVQYFSRSLPLLLRSPPQSKSRGSSRD